MRINPNWSRYGTVACFVSFLLGCQSATAPTPENAASASSAQATAPQDDQCELELVDPYRPDAAEIERDQIYTLLAYAVVDKDWQTHGWLEGDKQTARGYNIGSVLVRESDDSSEVVCWARNSVIVTKNKTQHGEVRLMTNYLRASELASFSSDKRPVFKLYTSLEPCAMCAGMMTLQSLAVTIFGQTDPKFGGVIGRLALNSKSVPHGYCPYPRRVESVVSNLPIRQKIDDAYEQWREDGNEKGLTAWLVTDGAKELYAEALEELQHFEVQHEENRLVFQAALEFYEKVPSDYTETPYRVACNGD